MERLSLSTILIAIALTTPIATVTAHTITEDPSHVGDITDPLGEDDPRTLGETTVPPSIDIEAAWVDASNSDKLVFNIQLADLQDLTGAQGWRYYAFWFDEGDGSASSCASENMVLPDSDLAVVASISPIGPVPIQNTANPWWLTCLPRDPTLGLRDTTPEPLASGSWQAGSGGDTVQVELPREFDGIRKDPVSFPVGSQLSGLQVATWTFTTPLNELDRGANIGGVVFYAGLPFADVTSVLQGPVTV